MAVGAASMAAVGAAAHTAVVAVIANTEHSLGAFVSVEETERLTRLLDSLREQHGLLAAEWEELMLQLEEQQVSR